jgi:hypothetical protein
MRLSKNQSYVAVPERSGGFKSGIGHFQSGICPSSAEQKEAAKAFVGAFRELVEYQVVKTATQENTIHRSK